MKFVVLFLGLCVGCGGEATSEIPTPSTSDGVAECAEPADCEELYGYPYGCGLWECTGEPRSCSETHDKDGAPCLTIDNAHTPGICQGGSCVPGG